MANRFAMKYQFGVESTAGTAVAADTMLLADPKPLTPDRRPIYPPAAIGVRAESHTAKIYQYLVQDTLTMSHGYFQALPVLFSCGLVGGVTPAEQTTSQADYLWDFDPALTGSNSLNSITLEEGDDTQAYETEYVMFERIRIAGTIAQDQGESPVTIEADYFGRQHSTASFTGSIDIPTAEWINAKLARLYIDTSWAGVGGTEKTALLRGFDIEILTGAHPKMLGSGNTYFDTHGQGLIAVTAALTLERSANSDAIWDAYRSQALQVVRLSIPGAQIGTGDTHTLTIDIGGTFEEVIPMQSEDRGNNIDTAMLRGYYDPTGAKICQVQVTTNVSAI